MRAPPVVRRVHAALENMLLLESLDPLYLLHGFDELQVALVLPRDLLARILPLLLFLDQVGQLPDLFLAVLPLLVQLLKFGQCALILALSNVLFVLA